MGKTEGDTSNGFSQASFRGRNDDVSESSTEFIAGLNRDWTQKTDVNFRVRFVIEQSTALTTDLTTRFGLRRSVNGGRYFVVKPDDTQVIIVSSNAVGFNQGDDCTEILGGTGAFISDNNAVVESDTGRLSGISGWTGSTTEFIETEWCLQLVSGTLDDGDTIELRLERANQDLFDEGYANTPKIVVSKKTILDLRGAELKLAGNELRLT